MSLNLITFLFLSFFLFIFLKEKKKVEVGHVFNPSTEVEGSLSSWLAWATEKHPRTAKAIPRNPVSTTTTTKNQREITIKPTPLNLLIAAHMWMGVRPCTGTRS